jgi:hypothetical protein
MKSLRLFSVALVGVLASLLSGCGPKPEPVDPATSAANVRPATGPRAGVPASAPDPVIPGRPGGAPAVPQR